MMLLQFSMCGFRARTCSSVMNSAASCGRMGALTDARASMSRFTKPMSPRRQASWRSSFVTRINLFSSQLPGAFQEFRRSGAWTNSSIHCRSSSLAKEFTSSNSKSLMDSSKKSSVPLGVVRREQLLVLGVNILRSCLVVSLYFRLLVKSHSHGLRITRSSSPVVSELFASGRWPSSSSSLSSPPPPLSILSTSVSWLFLGATFRWNSSLPWLDPPSSSIS
mmetsp:Transcript_100142/g.238758  ORF Transcript_100142/g.238758 Transcript_100142/m.238758 type:complete len:221 (-) Transcript_100142:214-876(-)